MHSNVSPQVTLHQVLVRAMEHWAVGKKRQKKNGGPNNRKVTASGTVVTVSATKKKNLNRYVPRNILPETWGEHWRTNTPGGHTTKTRRGDKIIVTRNEEKQREQNSTPLSHLLAYIHIYTYGYVHIYMYIYREWHPPQKGRVTDKLFGTDVSKPKRRLQTRWKKDSKTQAEKKWPTVVESRNKKWGRR